MRPSVRISKKRKVKTPSGRLSYHKIPKKTKQSCGVTGSRLLGKRRNRKHPELAPKVSKELIKAKVRNYAKKE